MTILTDKELEKKNTKNLLYIKRKLMPIVQSIGYCDMCKDFCCGDYCYAGGSVVQPNTWEIAHQDYMGRIKKILATREHIARNKTKGKRRYDI